jgi:hypothetical protein
VLSEGVLNTLDPSWAFGDYVEARFAAFVLGVGGQPHFRRAFQTTPLLRRDHLQRISPTLAAFRLHLAEDERPPAAQDEVELVAARPDVRREYAVAP